jgi:hypothetical protein
VRTSINMKEVYITGENDYYEGGLPLCEPVRAVWIFRSGGLLCRRFITGENQSFVQGDIQEVYNR